MSGIKLVVRSANHKQPDFHMVLTNEMVTVGDIKAYLSKNYPDKPDQSFMRMIYQGHLLANDKLSADVFAGANDDSCVVHLVCLPRIKTDIKPVQSSTRTASDTPPSTSNSSIPLSSENREQTAAEVSRSNPTQTPTIHNIQSPFQTAQQLPTFLPSDPGRADSALAEWYSRYYASWLVYLSSVQNQIMANTPQANFIRNIGQPVAFQAPAGEAGHQAAPAAPAVHEHRNVNAAGGALFDDDDEDGHARDLLDWVYVAIRAGILLSLVYLYSSVPRIFALVAMLGSVWLLRAAVAGFQNNRNRNAANAANANQEHNVNPENERQQNNPVAERRQNENPEENVVEEQNRNVESAQPAAQEPARIPIYRVVFSAIAGFFLSLFPDVPGLHPHAD